MSVDIIERGIYADIASHDGIKAKDIGKHITYDKHLINQYLYKAPFMKELCYRDEEYRWHGLIRQARPHVGLGDFCGYYGTVGEFLELTDQEWFEAMLQGCSRNGRNLNDTRGLFHSFRDCREVMVGLFRDLSEALSADNGANVGRYSGVAAQYPGVDLSWEIAFELRINRSKYIRIYADVLVITQDKVFSLEFKMKDKIEEEELSQAAKYTEYLEVLFGPAYDVIPCLVLTKATDLYTYRELPGTTAEVPVASGDMLFNLLDEYMGFLED